MKTKKLKRIEILHQRAKAAATWRARRNLTGMDAKDFAKKYGLIASSYNRWETGDTIPSNPIIEYVEKCLKKEGV